jgi:hypothetical protein
MVEVTAETLQDFLEQLGRCYRRSGRLYLVGGSSLILVNVKISTFDIDLQFDVPDEYQNEFIRCLREISRQRQLPVEQASPEQFIPLPLGYQNRHQFIGRYSSLDVFHYDFYSVALSKLHRGNEKDYVDAIGMVKQGLISLPQLREQFNEVLPQLEAFDIRVNAEDFERNFNLFEQRLIESRPGINAGATNDPAP